jgi:tRNA A-37 threonylcarbamoyl transferase component Bud32
MRASDWVPDAVIAARYRLVRRVGEGGMGVIWAAGDLVTGRRVALKRIKDSVDDPAARRRFLVEARAASAVRHPNVVEILDVLEFETGPPALAMELLEGESLRDVLTRDRALSVPALADLLVPVISAVGAAHALGVVHRDLKPENIFLGRSTAGARIVKVLDFGIAKLTALDGEAMRSAGTPAYMAPEQVFGERDIDHRADIWALGVVVYECLAGVRPTDGDNVGQVLKHVVAKPFAPLAQRVADLPDGVSRLVERMLQRERSHRIADLHDVLAVLEPFATAPGVVFDAPAAQFAAVGDAAVAETVPVEPRRGAADAVVAARGLVAPGPPPARRRTRRAIALGLAAALALIGLGLVRARRSAPEPPVPVASPLADPASKLACPILRASGVDVEEPSGWLGAAAAATACERARVILGGRPGRTLVPAELLGLPAGPSAAYRAAPYGEPDARDRTVDAARRSAQAYLDGEVTHNLGDFTVALALRRPDGIAIGIAAGRGQSLYQAVRSAMALLVGPAGIPRASRLEPEIAAWSRTDSVDDALGVLDLTFAIDQNGGGLASECRRFDALRARVGELGVEGHWLCAYTLGQQPPDVELGASDASDAARATRIRIDHSVHHASQPGDLRFLREQVQREPTPRGRSLIAATLSCLQEAADPAEALDSAILAVRSEPKNSEGGRCNAWEQLMTLERDTPDADGAMRAMQAWVPWNSYAWFEPGLRADGKDPAALPMIRRAYLLSPLDTWIAGTLARGLLAMNDAAAARSVAVDLHRGGLAIHDVESTMIVAQIEVSNARFGAALERLQGVSRIGGADADWLRVQRFEAGWRALELAVLLGRGAEVADSLVERFIARDPAPLDANEPSVPKRIPAICALASRPEPCFARFHALRPSLAGAVTAGTDELVEGAERYVRRDYAGATRAWRQLLAGHMALALVLPEAMTDAFEHDRAPDLADSVDREVMKRAAEFHGATLAHVRAARRAYARRDFATARQLAEQVVTAWSRADDEPPALAEMRRLAEQLRR